MMTDSAWLVTSSNRVDYHFTSNNRKPVFMVLMNIEQCRVAADIRTSRPTWAAGLPVAVAAIICTHHHSVLLLFSLNAGAHFAIQQKVEGCVDQRTPVRVCSRCIPYTSFFHNKKCKCLW